MDHYYAKNQGALLLYSKGNAGTYLASLISGRGTNEALLLPDARSPFSFRHSDLNSQVDRVITAWRMNNKTSVLVSVYYSNLTAFVPITENTQELVHNIIDQHLSTARPLYKGAIWPHHCDAVAHRRRRPRCHAQTIRHHSSVVAHLGHRGEPATAIAQSRPGRKIATVFYLFRYSEITALIKDFKNLKY